jgi:hypothetical protein
MKRILLAGLVALFVLGGCVQIDKIPDDQLAKDLNIGAEKAVEYGLKYLIHKDPAVAQAVKDNAKLADDVIKKNILPVFSGASTGAVLKSAVDAALSQLQGVLQPNVRAAIQLALDVLTANIPLPANPADKIDDRTKKAVNGLFGGIAAGLDAFLATQAPPPTIGPTTAREAGLHWSK